MRSKPLPQAPKSTKECTWQQCEVVLRGRFKEKRILQLFFLLGKSLDESMNIDGKKGGDHPIMHCNFCIKRVHENA